MQDSRSNPNNVNKAAKSGPRTAVVDVGGGMRGIYATGVFDYFLDHDIVMDAAYGVSAGSANAITYLAGQRGRCKRFYQEYALRPQYMSLRNFITKRSFIDMDYVYGTLSNSDGEDPVDFPAVMANPAQLYVLAADAITGETVVMGKKDMQQDDYAPLKASSAIPGVCHPYEAGGHLCFDGALGDTVPVQRALDDGFDRVVLILTKPRDFVRTADADMRIARIIRHKYPQAAQALAGRAQRYNEGVALAKRYQEEGRVLVVAPDDTCGVDTLTRDPDKTGALYDKGYADGAQVAAWLGQN